MKYFYFLITLTLLNFGNIPRVLADAGEIYNIPIKTIDGKNELLSEYKNKVLMIVNVASHCGYTPQYAGLEKLYEKYKEQGFLILGFPSNDFGGQEPGSNSEIKHFCSLKYDVKFPLYEKNPVSGEKIEPLYSYLISKTEDKSQVKWNFEKFLIARDGHLVKRFRSAVTPDNEELEKSVQGELAKPGNDKK
jgi:glutathione peroxidase